MPLRRRKHFRAPGTPEIIAVVLVIAVAIPATLWLRADQLSYWQETTGRVIHGKVQSTHINSEAYQPKVDVVYEYTVDGTQYSGEFEGFWPAAYSPNALPADRLNMLTVPNQPLTVLYDPRNPEDSRLHATDDVRKTIYLWTFFTALVVSLYYFLRVYPRLRGAR